MKDKQKIIYVVIFTLFAVIISFLILLYVKFYKYVDFDDTSDNRIDYSNSDNIDIYKYDDVNFNVMSGSANTYNFINSKVKENEMVNILALADLQMYSYGPWIESIVSRINTMSKLQNMDLAVTLGDINVTSDDKEDSINNLKKITLEFNKFSVPTLFTVGNHDRFSHAEDPQDVTLDEYFDIAYENIDSSCVFNKADPKKPYYYKDIENKKMRVCVLNCFSGGHYEFLINNEQLEFIAEEMLDFSNKKDPENWTVAFFIHTIVPTEVHQEYVYGSDNLFKILSSYKKGKLCTIDQEKVYDFSSMSRANICAIFTGHHHLDYTIEKDGILVIGISSIIRYNDRGVTSSYSNWSENNVDINFEILSIDTKNKVIYSTKVGNGQNRFWNY